MSRVAENNNENIEFFKASVAEKHIEIEFTYHDIIRSCRGYFSKFETPDFVFRATQEDIERERRETEAMEWAEGDSFRYSSKAKLETMAICRKLADALLNEGFLLFHGAAIAAEGKCYLFMAKSGTGKTTHIKKWQENHPESFVVNGDKPLIDMNNLMVYGTPWCGKERMGTNTSVPLGGLIQLERGEKNEIVPISFGEMLPCLLHQCHIPSPTATVSVMRLLAMLQNTPCWRLHCNIDDDAGEVSYNALVR